MTANLIAKMYFSLVFCRMFFVLKIVNQDVIYVMFLGIPL